MLNVFVPDLTSGDPQGIILGVLTGLLALSTGFVWLIRRQDKLYDTSEKFHLDWLKEEQLRREFQAKEFQLEKDRLEKEIEDLRLEIKVLHDDLNMCMSSCRKVTGEKIELESRIRILEMRFNVE